MSVFGENWMIQVSVNARVDSTVIVIRLLAGANDRYHTTVDSGILLEQERVTSL